MTYQAPSDMFTVQKCALVGGGNVKMPMRGLIVNEGGHRFGLRNVVSDSYEIHQPAEILESFERVAQATDLKIDRVLTNPTNASIMISAEYSQTKFVGEDHSVKVVFYTSHDGKNKTFLTLQALRMACMNQAPILARGKDQHLFAEKHYRNSLNINSFERILSDVPQSVGFYNDSVDLLNATKMTRAQFVEWYIESNKLDRNAKQFDTKVNNLMSAYDHADNKDITTDTAYKGFHALTWLNTHGGRKTTYQEENKVISKAKDTQKQMDKLLALCTA